MWCYRLLFLLSKLFYSMITVRGQILQMFQNGSKNDALQPMFINFKMITCTAEVISIWHKLCHIILTQLLRRNIYRKIIIVKVILQLYFWFLRLIINSVSKKHFSSPRKTPSLSIFYILSRMQHSTFASLWNSCLFLLNIFGDQINLVFHP